MPAGGGEGRPAGGASAVQPVSAGLLQEVQAARPPALHLQHGRSTQPRHLYQAHHQGHVPVSVPSAVSPLLHGRAPVWSCQRPPEWFPNPCNCSALEPDARPAVPNNAFPAAHYITSFLYSLQLITSLPFCIACRHCFRG